MCHYTKKDITPQLPDKQNLIFTKINIFCSHFTSFHNTIVGDDSRACLWRHWKAKQYKSPVIELELGAFLLLRAGVWTGHCTFWLHTDPEITTCYSTWSASTHSIFALTHMYGACCQKHNGISDSYFSDFDTNNPKLDERNKLSCGQLKIELSNADLCVVVQTQPLTRLETSVKRRVSKWYRIYLPKTKTIYLVGMATGKSNYRIHIHRTALEKKLLFMNSRLQNECGSCKGDWPNMNLPVF